MKKKATLFVISLISFFNSSFAQNLVPNGSFEQFDTCPTNVDRIFLAIGWSDYLGSCDYFNSCNSIPNTVGVPSNFAGYQFAKDGNAYAGFVPFNTTGHNIRECLGAKLTQSLIIGEKYFAAFYVSRAVQNSQSINVATNKIGIKFSTIDYSNKGTIPINNKCSVYADSIITDTLNWVKISGSFIADSAYQFIAISNFFTDSATSYIQYDSAINAYYYVDDIRLSTDSNYVNGISEYNSIELVTAFPNPARDWIAIRGNDVQSLVLYDVLGRIVFTSNSEFISPAKINTSFLQRGLYFLETKTKSTVITQKLILQ